MPTVLSRSLLISKDLEEIVNDKRYTQLHHCCRNHLFDYVKLLVEAGANVHAKDYMGLTPLHFAAIAGNIRIVKYLVETALAQVNAKDTAGSTPLNHAAYGNHIDVVKYLARKNAGIHVMDRFNCTPLRIAAGQGHHDLADYLYPVAPCANCGKLATRFCSCQKERYCDENCQHKHRKAHKMECKKELQRQCQLCAGEPMA